MFCSRYLRVVNVRLTHESVQGSRLQERAFCIFRRGPLQLYAAAIDMTAAASPYAVRRPKHCVCYRDMTI